MNILITGGAGFLGRQLAETLARAGRIALDDEACATNEHPIGRITCFDVVAGTAEGRGVVNVAGDITDPKAVSGMVDADTGVVIHLAAVVSGTAEADFDLGMRVNVDGTRNLLEACRHAGHQPRVLFSSSVAVFGGELPKTVTDSTTPTPQGSYGAQKLIGEMLVQDYTRKGFIDGRSVRVPTVVVRPGRPNGAASGFASGIIREPLSGLDAVLPVPAATQMWIASPRAVISMFLHALSLAPAAWGWHRSINLPGLVATMDEELSVLRELAGPEVSGRVRDEPDPAVIRLVKTWAARFDTSRARELGFVADADCAAIVRSYIEDNRDAIKVPVRLPAR